jgi:glycosyltransferase involved in cell wall biosynthesis
MVLLPDHVALIFLGQGEGAGTVRTLADRLGIAERVFVIPPVPPEQVAAAIRSADVSVSLMRSESWNTRAALPNKLFEAVGAGVPVLASDMFVLRRVVRRYDLGQCCDPGRPESIAAALRRLLAPEAQTYYRDRIRAAQSELNWRNEAHKLCAFYARRLPVTTVPPPEGEPR